MSTMSEQNIGLTKDELRTVLTVRYRNLGMDDPGKIAKETIIALEGVGVSFYEVPKVGPTPRRVECSGRGYPQCCSEHREAYYNTPA